MTTERTATNPIDRWAGLLLLAIAVAVRVRTFGNPVIGFDEQFYLLVGDRMWQGAVPFVDIFDRKPIGLFLIYAAARGLGGDGFLAYKLVALGFVVATAVLLYRIARRDAGPVAALTAAALYILWLNFMEGEGGQSPVFYNLPMIAAAGVVAGGGDVRRRGALAMLLVGIAIQIKYSVVFEGIFFGCWLIVAGWRSGMRLPALAGCAALWIGCALLPTLVAFGVYAVMGHGQAFLFANFLSVFAQGRSAPADQIEGAATMVGILLIPLLFLAIGRRHLRGGGFLPGWLAASIAGVVIYWRFPSPQYAMPVLLPLFCLIAPVLDAGRRWRVAGFVLAGFGFVGGQAVLTRVGTLKGGAAEAARVARAADPRGKGCIFVYDGYPGLYMLTHSCLPTRWPFPAHLSTLEESRAAALGVDQRVELSRILATRPVAIVDDFPRFAGGNPATHAILQRTLDAAYALDTCVPTGVGRVRLVYRLRSAVVPRPTGCPAPAALRRGF